MIGKTMFPSCGCGKWDVVVVRGLWLWGGGFMAVVRGCGCGKEGGLLLLY